MNLASVGGSTADVKPRESGSCPNRFETGFDLLLDVAKDRKDLVAAHIGRAMSGNLFRGSVKRNDVSEEVGGYETAAHALDDAVVEQTIISKVSGGACEL